MTPKLALDLWRFPPFRRNLMQEARRFALGLLLGSLLVAVYRQFSGRGFPAGYLLDIALGLATISLSWVLSVVRTLRAVLREHGLLER